jgi:hypothetical protein
MPCLWITFRIKSLAVNQIMHYAGLSLSYFSVLIQAEFAPEMGHCARSALGSSFFPTRKKTAFNNFRTQ